jgi:hypothetical protein
VKFRETRGSFDASMQTCVEIKNHSELVAHLRTIFGPTVTASNVRVGRCQGTDPRNGWNTHEVIWDGKAIGFTNGPLRWE